MGIVLGLTDASEYQLLEAMLSVRGHDVITCPRDRRVVKVIEEARLCVFVLDIQFLSEMADLCSSFVNASRVNAGVVILCDSLSSQLRAQLYSSGADDVIERPIDGIEFAARIDAVLRRLMRATRYVRVGRVSIGDTETSVCVDDVKIELTVSEWRLLRCLMCRAGQVVTRAELLSEVWSYTRNPGSNLLDVHIAHLRQKLGNAATQLRCVRGIGFCFHADSEDSEIVSCLPRSK
jgi:DNA-binding response OmpR family regulator